MRTLIFLPVAFVCLGVGLSHPQAAMRDAAWELGLFVGSYELTEDDFDADSNSNVSGVRVGFQITEEHEIEFVYDSVDYEFAGFRLEEIESWSLRYLYNWSLGPRQTMVPYVGAGLGEVEDTVFDVPVDPFDPFSPLVDFSDDDTQVSFFGGLRVFAGRTFALRGEAAYKAFSTFDVDQSVLEFTLGLSWVIGGR